MANDGNLLKRGFDLLRQGLLDEAEAVARQAVEGQTEPGAEAYYLMGCVLASQSDLAGAVRVLEQALSSPTDEWARLRHQLKLAEVLREQTELQRAEALLRENLERAQKLYGPREVPVALTLRALAEVTWQRGLLAEAREQMEEALNILFSHGDSEAGRTMARLAVLRSLSGEQTLLERLGDLPGNLQDEAVDELVGRIPMIAASAAERLMNALENKLQREEHLQQLRRLRQQLDGTDCPHQQQQRAHHQELGKQIQLGNLEEAVELELELARLASWSGRASEAEKILRESLERCNQKGAPRIQGRVGRALAQTLAEQQRTQEAFLAAEAALAAAELCGDNLEIGLAAAILGGLYLREASPGRARPLLTMAVVHIPPEHPEWFGARQHLRSLLEKGGGPSERPISERLRDATFHKLPEDLLSSLFIARDGRLRATFQRRPSREELTLLRRILNEFGSDIEQELDQDGLPPGLGAIDSPSVLLRWN